MQFMRLQHCAETIHVFKRQCLFSTAPFLNSYLGKISIKNDESVVKTKHICSGYFTRDAWLNKTGDKVNKGATISTSIEWDSDRFCNSSFRLTSLSTNNPFAKELLNVSNEFQRMSQIDPLILSNLTAMGFQSASIIQQKAIGLFDAGYDFLMESEYGSGKTLAYLLPLLTKISQTYPEEMMEDIISCNGTTQYPLGLVLSKSPYSIYLIGRLTNKLLSNVSMRPVSISKHDKINTTREILKGCHVLITEPSVVGHHCSNGSLSLKHLKYLVIDDADLLMNSKLLDPSFFISQNQSSIPAKENRQTIMVKDILKRSNRNLKTEFLRDDALFLSVGDPQGNVKDVQHSLEMFHTEEEKVAQLIHLLRSLEISSRPIVVLVGYSNDIDPLIEKLKKELVDTDISNDIQKFNDHCSKRKVFVTSVNFLQNDQLQRVHNIINLGMPSNSMDYCYRSGFIDTRLSSCSMHTLIGPSSISKISPVAVKHIATLLESIGQPKQSFFDGLLPCLTSRVHTNSDDKFKSEHAIQKGYLSPFSWKQKLQKSVISTKNIMENTAFNPHLSERHFNSTFDIKWAQPSSLPLPFGLSDKHNAIDSLHSCIQDYISEMKLRKLTAVQTMSIKLFNTGHDFFIQAENGSGKTLAYLFPLISEMLRSYPHDAMQKLDPQVRKVYPTGLILSPNSNSVRKIAWDAIRLSYDFPMRTVSFYDSSFRDDLEILNKGCHLAVGTVQRIEKLIKDGILSLECCQYLVIDDADFLFNHRSFSMESIFENLLTDTLSSKRQTVMVSEFMTNETCTKLMKFMRPDPLMLTVGNVGSISKNIKYDFQLLDNEELKNSALINLLKKHSDDTFVIFCYSLEELSEVVEFLKHNGIECDSNCYNPIEQKHVTKTKIFVTTIRQLRGINSPTVMRVVNLYIPMSLSHFLNILTPLDASVQGSTVHTLVSPRNLAFFQMKHMTPLQQIMDSLDQPNSAFFDKIMKIIQRNNSDSEPVKAHGNGIKTRIDDKKFIDSVFKQDI